MGEKSKFYKYIFKSLYLILLSNFMIRSKAEISKLYGVPVEKKELYIPKDDGLFKCLDGSKIIQYSSVNDDYCDCPDGSDEPGTSACKNFVFNCRNEGHISANISSKKVNDGVCDPECCDGSDEYSGIITCPNVCEKISKKHNEEKMKNEKILKEGLLIKDKYIKEASEMTLKENKKKQKLENEIKIIKNEIEKIKEIKSIASEMDKRVKSEIEKKKNKIIINECPNLLKECNKSYNRVNSDFKNKEKKNEILTETQTNVLNIVNNIQNMLLEDENNEGKDSLNLIKIKESINKISEEIKFGNERIENIENELKNDNGNEESGDNSDDESKTDSFKLNLHIENELETNIELSPCEDLTKTNLSCIYSGIKSIYHNTVLDIVNDVKRFKNWKGWHKFNYSVKKDVKLIYSYMNQKYMKLTNIKKMKKNENFEQEQSNNDEFKENYEELKSNFAGAKAVLNKLEDKLSKKKREIDEINTKKDIDFGPNNVFKTLYNKCFEVEASGYKYSLCLYKDAKQKPKNGNSSTSLGKWSHFNGQTEMVFKNGEKCWNGPERSTHVKLECSNENEIVSVSEPSKCEYHMIFRTPAICNNSQNIIGNKKDKTNDEL